MRILSCELTAINSPSLSITDTGLGNVLFQIATTYGLARHTDRVWIIPQLDELCTILEKWGLNHRSTIFRNIPVSSEPNPISKTCPNLIVYERSGESQRYDQEMISTLENTITLPHIQLSGYLQSHMYFDKYKDSGSVLRALFSPDPFSLQMIETKYPWITLESQESIPVVSVHLRHHYGQCPVSFKPIQRILYERFVQNENVSNLRIAVFSNDFEATQIILNDNLNQIPKEWEWIHIPEELDYIHLWMMSICTYHILSHSTMSWWGAYLNSKTSKEVMVPEEVLQICHGQYHPTSQKTERRTQHYLPEWVFSEK